MTSRVVGLYFSPWPRDPEALKRSRNPFDLYRYALWYKANPRSPDYMRRLFEERHPGASFIEIDAGGQWRDAIRAADNVVLLYPDATGLGFASIERAVRRAKSAQTTVHALNGRRREFLLDPSTRVALGLRHALVRTMLLELCCIPVFVVLTPMLLLADFIRGRR